MMGREQSEWRGGQGEPSRWLDEVSPTGDAMRSFGAVARPQAMSAAEEARLAARVAILTRGGHLPGHGSSSFAPGALKVGALTVAVGLAGVWGARQWLFAPAPTLPVGVAVKAPESRRAASLAVSGAPSEASSGAPSSEASSEASSGTPAPSAPSAALAAEAARLAARPGPSLAARSAVRHARVAAPPAAADAANTDTLALEARLLDEARELLVEAPTRALGVLAEHRRRFPQGQLAAEREFMSIDALSRLGRVEDARRRADALRAAHPQSSYVARAARLLDGR